jgi:hypothetical protein
MLAEKTLATPPPPGSTTPASRRKSPRDHGPEAPKLKEHPGAAPITLRRYTHVLEGELERAFAQLEAFLTEREAEESEPALAA